MESGKRPGVVDWVERAMKMAAAACVMGMALLTGADVVSRGVWNAPIMGTEELVSLLAVLAMGLSMPYAHAQGSNVGVEVLYRRFRRPVRRRITRCTDAAGAALFGLTAWRLAVYAATLADSGEVSMNLELPAYRIVYALAGCFAVLALFLALDMAKSFTKAGK
ncbi:MAG: TRAP transporter small permease [Desulfovibrionaceae bacterium]